MSYTTVLRRKYRPSFLALLLMGVFMLTSLAHASTQGQDQGLDPNILFSDPAKIITLQNGLRVYILKDERFPLVSTRLYVKAGSAYETEDEAGISHVLEHMVFKGTDKRPKGGIAKDVEAVGGYLNAATSFDYTVYLTDLPSAHWALGLDIVKDMAFHPTLDAAELESEKKVVLAELQRGKDSPGTRIFHELQKHALKGTTYARPIIGYENTINAITPESMRNYIAKYYQPQNMLLVVVGNVDPDAVLTQVKELYGDLENTADMLPVTPLDPEKMYNSSVSMESGAWNKVYLGMALPVPGDDDVRAVPLSLMAHMLGGDATSYLYQKYKYEKQLVDNIFVGSYNFERVGMLYFTVQLDAAKVETFWKEFVADLAKLDASVFSEKDLARAQLLTEDSFQRTKETLSGLASWKGQLELFYGGAQGERNMLTDIKSVTLEQVQEAMSTWLVPQRLSVAVLTPNTHKDAVWPDFQKELHAQWPAPAQKKYEQSDRADGHTETIELGQGRKLILIPDSTMPYTAVDLYFTGGNSLQESSEQGLAALTARVLTSGTKGTHAMTAPEMESYLAERAAAIGAFTGRQVFGITMKEPTRFDADLFSLFRTVLTQPAFAEEEVAREKNNQIAAIRSRDDQALGLAFSHIPPFLFEGEHPYAFKSLGTIENVEGMTKEMIVSFWEKQKAQPWVLAVAGSYDKEAVIAFAKSLPAPTATSAEIKEPTWAKDSTLDLHLAGREQGHLLMIFKGVASNHPDAVGLELLQIALSNQSGILFRELRDNQGLGYTVTAQNHFLPKTGYMFFYIGTEPEKMSIARQGFEDVIADIQKNAIPEADVRSAQNQMEGDYYRQRQSLSSRTGEAATLSILGEELDFSKQRVEDAKKWTPEDLRRLAQKYLVPDEAYVVTVTP